ncbi:MAG: hypothetical protein HY293_19415 [Planctomycetes bacterium]|nr:hypothetical protein [Planctomycetota bacterium]
MSFRNTASRVPVLAALACLLASCSGGGGGVSSSAGPSSDDPLVLKISYFRALPDGRTKKLECHFRCVMSESWRDRMGDSPREPLAKGAPGRIYMGYVADPKMALYLKRLKEFGLNDLIPMKPEEIRPEDLARASLDPTKTSFIRVFTVGDEKGSKSYYYPHQQTSKDLIEKFVKCETYISRACEYAINVSSSSDPLPGRTK